MKKTLEQILEGRPMGAAVPGTMPTVAGLKSASNRRTAAQLTFGFSALALALALGWPRPPTPSLPAADVLLALQEAQESGSAETPPGTEILSLFDVPSTSSDLFLDGSL